MAGFSVLDIFSGIGGLSKGFSESGFKVSGADLSDRVGQVYEKFTSGDFTAVDLGEKLIRGSYDVLVGGPPCKPWAPMNLSRRSVEHRDYLLVERFALHVKTIMPEVFILENVPALRSDEVFSEHIRSLAKLGYSVGITLAKSSAKRNVL